MIDLREMPEMLPQFMEIMEYSFPFNERRLPDDYKAYLTDNNKDFTVSLFIENSELFGFLTHWQLSGHIFIEHFAVSHSHRNRGFGKAILAEFIEQSNASLVLEVEPPDNEISQRRITFYERLEFVVNPYKYIQPPYHNDADSLNMLLMTNRLLLNDEFISLRNEIYAKVYKTSINSL